MIKFGIIFFILFLCSQLFSFTEGGCIQREDPYKREQMLEDECPLFIVSSDTTDTIKGYMSNGDIRYCIPYENGKKNGIEMWFFVDGNIEKFASYKNDTLHGISAEFHRGKNSIIKEIMYNSGKITQRNTFESFFLKEDTLTYHDTSYIYKRGAFTMKIEVYGDTIAMQLYDYGYDYSDGPYLKKQTKQKQLKVGSHMTSPFEEVIIEYFKDSSIVKKTFNENNKIIKEEVSSEE